MVKRKLQLTNQCRVGFCERERNSLQKIYNGKLYEIKPLVYSYLNDEDVISFFSNELLQEGE